MKIAVGADRAGFGLKETLRGPRRSSGVTRLRDGDLFAPGNPVESPGEMGLRLEGANSFHAASRPRRGDFS
jgi:hypothetical protein